jgi:serine/threonine-protein phosphatase 5
VGLQFGPDITKKFLADNNLKLLVRSHEVRRQQLVDYEDAGLHWRGGGGVKQACA